jgi:hypothetical protein
MHSLGFKVRSVPLISHVSTHEQQLNRVTDSQALPNMLQAQQRRSWHEIVTFAELWFHPDTDYEQMWLAPAEAPRDRERDMIQSLKLMLTTLLGVTRLHAIQLPVKGSTFQTKCWTDEILSEIPTWPEADRGRANRRLVVDASNARLHAADRTL